MWLGLILGAALGVYLYLPPRPLGLFFPNINGEYMVRPTFIRLSAYLIGRWVGFCLIGTVFGWAAHFWMNPLLARLLAAACILFALFMLLYLITSHSPEVSLAGYCDASNVSAPVFIKGLLSTGLLVAPTLIGIGWGMIKFPGLQADIFFSNFFLGNAFISLPVLLNIKWHKNAILVFILKGVLFFGVVSVLLASVDALLKI
ncbi:hypothetical protein JW933_05385 [candidate division FCPU426 bacterium]|nr:hypothetical protein [candidate division FCPU426 bacterium]